MKESVDVVLILLLVLFILAWVIVGIQLECTIRHSNSSYFDFYTRPYIQRLIQSPFQPIGPNQIQVGGRKIKFITTYHYTNPQDQIDPESYNIVLDGEPMDLSNVSADLILTTKKTRLPNSVPSIYVPYYATYCHRIGLSPRELIKTSRPQLEKSKFCFFAYSNCDEKFSGVRDRRQFYQRLQERSGHRVDNWGKCYNNKTVPSKVSDGDNIQRLKPYKFCIAFENEQIEGYITEKIMNPMLAWTIPIYLGAPDVSEHFNPKSFIHVRDFPSFDDCIDYILRVDADPQLYDQILSEPWLKDNQLHENFSFVTGGKFDDQYREVLPDDLKGVVFQNS